MSGQSSNIYNIKSNIVANFKLDEDLKLIVNNLKNDFNSIDYTKYVGGPIQNITYNDILDKNDKLYLAEVVCFVDFRIYEYP